MKVYIGDWWQRKGRPDEKVRITDISYITDIIKVDYYIKEQHVMFDYGMSLEHLYEDYELISLPVGESKKCECGLKYSRDGGKHSDWCPLFGRD